MVEDEDEASRSTSPPGRVKFFCSYGGRILPRPSDGTLKYIGGENRVIVVPRSLTFSDLMEKINNLVDGEYVLKYQIASEDLDSLVTVKSDEDVRHLLDEYDRLEREGSSKLRTFLFPPRPAVESQVPLSLVGSQALEQRFVDAINGIVRHINISQKTPINTSRLKSLSPSPTDCSSPQSLSPRSVTSAANQDSSLISTLQSRLSRMHKAQSSPSICSLGSHHNTGIANSSTNQQPSYGCSKQQQPQSYRVGYQSPPQSHHHGYQSPNPPQHYCGSSTPSQDHHNRGHQSPNPPHHFRGSSTPPQDHQSHWQHGCQYPTYDHHMLSLQPPLVVGGGYSKLPCMQGSFEFQNPGYLSPMISQYPVNGGHTRWQHLEQYEAAYGNNKFMRADNYPPSPGDTWG